MADDSEEVLESWEDVDAEVMTTGLVIKMHS